MDFHEAHKLAINQHPVRRPTWPEHHHVRHYLEESTSKLKLHTPGQPEAVEWLPEAEDEAAQDWEQYLPQSGATQEEPQAG
jgi:hypothetical protein